MWPMLVTDFLRIFERSFYSLPRISNLAQHICSPGPPFACEVFIYLRLKYHEKALVYRSCFLPAM
jgi:hypothetical protein